MDRREMLRTLGVVGAAAAPAAMVAQQAAHVHGTADHQALIAASSNCVVKGEACMAHCQQMLAAGDRSMLPDCPRLGIEMVTICGALRTLAAQDAPSLPKLAAAAKLTAASPPTPWPIVKNAPMPARRAWLSVAR